MRPYAISAILVAAPLFAQPDPALLRKLFEDGLAKRRAEFGLADARTAQAARDLSGFLLREGDEAAAREALVLAVSIDEQAFGASAPQTLEDAFELASLSTGEEQGALWLRASASPDPLIAGPALSSLAALRREAGDLPAAAAYLRRALVMAEQADGKDGLIVASLLSSLGGLVPPPEAVPVMRRANDIYRQKLGPADPQTAISDIFLARGLFAIGQSEEAIRFSRHALEVLQNQLGPNDATTSIAATDLSSFLRRTDQIEEAQAVERQFNVRPR